jgi:hypothetical protein
MSSAAATLYGAIAVTTIGMMLVVAGVIVAGLFLPGVVLIGIGMLTFAAAALLHGLSAHRADRAAQDRAPARDR